MNRSWLIYGLVIIPGALWGFAAILVEIALRELPPISLTALRATITSFVLIVLLYGVGGRLPTTKKAWRNYFWIGLFNNALPFTLMTFGQVSVSSGLATILVSTMPLFTILLAHFYTEEKLTPIKGWGIVVGFAGVLVLLGPRVLLGIGQDVWGQLLVIAAALAYAIGGVIARNYFEEIAETGSDAGNHGFAFVLETTTSQYIAVTIYLLPLSLLFDAPWGLTVSRETWGAMLLLSVVFTVVAAVVYFYLIETAGAGVASTAVYLVPIFGVIGSNYFLEEPITIQIVLALAFILVGIGLVNREPAEAGGVRGRE